MLGIFLIVIFHATRDKEDRAQADMLSFGGCAWAEDLACLLFL